MCLITECVFFRHVQPSFRFQDVLCILFLEALSEDISGISDSLRPRRYISQQRTPSFLELRANLRLWWNHFLWRTYQARNQLHYSESFENVVLNILVFGYIQECNISNLTRWVFLPVPFVLYKGWTVWIVSDFWVWHEMILLSCLHELSTSDFHQIEQPISLCCSAVQQVHYYILTCIYQVD